MSAKTNSLYIGFSPGLGLRRESSKTFPEAEAEISIHYRTSVLAAGIEINTKDSSNTLFNIGVKQLIPFLGAAGKTSGGALFLTVGIGGFHDFKRGGISFEFGLGGIFFDRYKGHILNLPKIRLFKYFDSEKSGAVTYSISYTYLMRI